MPDPFRILVVCTGNICRSPMAQAYLTQSLRDRLGRETADAHFAIASAGTHGVVGHPIEAAAMDVLGGWGVTPDPFEARELVASYVEDADLVLGASREHRAAVVTLVPRASQRTFTLREFARLAAEAEVPGDVATSADPVERVRALVRAAAGLRGFVRGDRPEDDDIADPYRQKAAAFERAGAQVREAVDLIVEAIARAVAPSRAG